MPPAVKTRNAYEENSAVLRHSSCAPSLKDTEDILSFVMKLQFIVKELCLEARVLCYALWKL